MLATTITVDDPRYPVNLRDRLGAHAPQKLVALGNLDLLQAHPLALFCSAKCPGDLILQTYDLAQALRDAGVPVVGGFHSPMERECLGLLLRGRQPAIVCLAQRLPAIRLPRAQAAALAEGRLLVLSRFGEHVRRATQGSAVQRNLLVAALADRVFVAHAAPGSRTEALCRQVVGWGKPLFAFDAPANAHILALGGRPLPRTSAGLDMAALGRASVHCDRPQTTPCIARRTHGPQPGQRRVPRQASPTPAPSPLGRRIVEP
jgi:predicted Rossmann fold nucleotide-binding protein DprA/Smf involved in DNA uptake